MQVVDPKGPKRPPACENDKLTPQIAIPDDDYEEEEEDEEENLDDDLDDDEDDDSDDLDDSASTDKTIAALSPSRATPTGPVRYTSSPWVTQPPPPPPPLQLPPRKHGQKRRGPDGKPLKRMPLAVSTKDYDRIVYAMAMRTSSLFRKTYGGSMCAQPTDDVSRGVAIAEICEAWAEMVADKR